MTRFQRPRLQPLRDEVGYSLLDMCVTWLVGIVIGASVASLIWWLA